MAGFAPLDVLAVVAYLSAIFPETQREFYCWNTRDARGFALVIAITAAIVALLAFAASAGG